MERVYSLGFFHGDLHAKNILVDTNFSPVIIDFGTSFFAGTPQKSHDRDAKMLQELCYEVVPELNDLWFIASDLYKTYPSKDLCDLMQAALDISWNTKNPPEKVDQYGLISDIVFPCARIVMNHSVLDKKSVLEYVKNYVDSYGYSSEQILKYWNHALEKD